jgi:hypothetical protein
MNFLPSLVTARQDFIVMEAPSCPILEMIPLAIFVLKVIIVHKRVRHRLLASLANSPTGLPTRIRVTVCHVQLGSIALVLAVLFRMEIVMLVGIVHKE